MAKKKNAAGARIHLLHRRGVFRGVPNGQSSGPGPEDLVKSLTITRRGKRLTGAKARKTRYPVAPERIDGEGMIGRDSESSALQGTAMGVSAPEPSDTHGKALALNLDGLHYGTLAEIGAGQEVARWFLSVGAASGTVAKTISAYDKIVSDEIYGGGTRYVSRERLRAMLDHEYRLLLERLTTTRGQNKRFFVFADTVAARNYQGTNEQHGWMGIRFQTESTSEPSDILLHVNLRDRAAVLQQQAVGILGVNLIYAALRQRSDRDGFLIGLFEQLSIERIEIDVIELEGPAFLAADAKEWCLALLARDMAHAIVFDPFGNVVEPANVLRKRPALIMRGTFGRAELLDPVLFESAKQQLFAEGARFEREPVTAIEMTTTHVSRATILPPAEMLRLIRELSMACPVIVSNFPETYLLSHYLRRYSTEPLRFVMSIAAAAKILHERFYQDLPGTLLEGLGKLLATNVTLYVAPMPRESFLGAVRDESGHVAIRGTATDVVGLDDLIPEPPARHLLEYLRTSGRITALK